MFKWHYPAWNNCTFYILLIPWRMMLTLIKYNDRIHCFFKRFRSCESVCTYCMSDCDLKWCKWTSWTKWEFSELQYMLFWFGTSLLNVNHASSGQTHKFWIKKCTGYWFLKPPVVTASCVCMAIALYYCSFKGFVALRAEMFDTLQWPCAKICWNFPSSASVQLLYRYNMLVMPSL